MASNRHLGRIVTLQTLFEHDFRSTIDENYDLKEVVERNLTQYDKNLDDKKFVENMIDQVIKKADELDDIISPLAPEWPIEQIARVDKLILRMSLYELRNVPETPPKVVINEAVELAKQFGNDNSSKFINGVLGSAYRQMEENSADSKQKVKKSTKTVKKKGGKS